MVTSPLQAILDELKETALMTNLVSALDYIRLNSYNSCVIPLPGGLKLRLELDKYEKNVLIGCVLGNLPPSVYRQKLFAEALKANGLPPPHFGIFGFSNHTSDLLLFQYLDLRNLTGQRLAEFLTPFLEKAKEWKEAIDNGNVPAVHANRSSSSDRGLFGIRL